MHLADTCQLTDPAVMDNAVAHWRMKEVAQPQDGQPELLPGRSYNYVLTKQQTVRTSKDGSGKVQHE
jgi:hypothetical protein